eukprot:523382_1
MRLLCVLLCVLINSRLIDGVKQSQDGNEGVSNLKHAFGKVKTIFRQQKNTHDQHNIINSHLEDVQLIEHNINVYDKFCEGIELFGKIAEKECSKYEDEMTDYLRNISKIPNPPKHHTIQFYWSEESIWHRVDTKFVCFESDHFKKLMNCLCSFCSWPFVIEDEKYYIYSTWEKEYNKRGCHKRTNKSFMQKGDSICKWMNMTVGNKGKQIAEKLSKEMNISHKNMRKNSIPVEDIPERASPESAAPTLLNNTPLLMTIVTIIIMICSAVFFVVTV